VGTLLGLALALSLAIGVVAIVADVFAVLVGIVRLLGAGFASLARLSDETPYYRARYEDWLAREGR
jgi:hypothetical protein